MAYTVTDNSDTINIVGFGQDLSLKKSLASVAVDGNNVVVSVRDRIKSTAHYSDWNMQGATSAEIVKSIIDSYIADSGSFIKITLLNISAGISFVIPANYRISTISVRNASANPVLGGLKFGSTIGGSDVILSFAVLANSFKGVFDSTIVKRVFSTTDPQTIYLDAVSGWNSAVISVYISLTNL